MKTKRTRVGIIGCGNISGIYSQAGKNFENLEIAACADLDLERAKARAAEFQIAKACGVDELLKDPSIEIVINLTIPKAHFEVGMQVLQAGKHLYNEKPLCANREDAKELLGLAESKGLRVGCAPDTFLGAGLQTCRKLIDDGWIGQPVGATAFMMGHGPEGWHPDPDFFYQPGGGPMFDMGPYYLTALVSLLGPVKQVSGATRISFPERRVGSGTKQGDIIQVNTPTHVAGLMEFESGPVGTILTSFDVWGSELPRMEIYGSLGTLSLPDPNTFGGPVRFRRGGSKEWGEIPLVFPNEQNSRGLGVADMASAIGSQRPHRASGKLAYHVLDLMHAFHEAAQAGKRLDVATRVERPEPLPLGLRPGQIDYALGFGKNIFWFGDKGKSSK